MQVEKNYFPPEMICGINKTETDLQHASRNQKPFEDQLESCQSLYHYTKIRFPNSNILLEE